MNDLDLKDRKILYELDLDARQSDSEIAKKVGLSKDAVRYRIQKLIDEGYINYFMTILNTMKLGFDWYRTFFKFQNLNPKKEEEIIDYLKEKASWITKVEGVWDLNAAFFCKNAYEYRDIINEFLLKYSEHIEKYDVAIVTRMWHHRIDYILDKKIKTSDSPVMGFNPEEKYESIKIDETDYKILKTILKDARMKTVDIARKIKSTEIVVRYRMKKMIDSGIILGFRPFLDLNQLGYIYFKLHLTLQNLTLERKKQLYKYIAEHPNSAHTTELVGGSDFETEFQVKNNEEFYEIVKDVRTRFADIIRDYEFMQYTNVYKFTYLPEMNL